MTFAEQLSKIMNDLGISDAQAAKLLGLESRQTIYNYRKGKREPPDKPIRSKGQLLDDLERLARDDTA